MDVGTERGLIESLGQIEEVDLARGSLVVSAWMAPFEPIAFDGVQVELLGGSPLRIEHVERLPSPDIERAFPGLHGAGACRYRLTVALAPEQRAALARSAFALAPFRGSRPGQMLVRVPEGTFPLPGQELIEEIGAGSATAFLGAASSFLGHGIQCAGLRPDDHVLDVGCGCGRMAYALAHYLGPDGRYEGFDISERAIAWASHSIGSRRAGFGFRRVDVYNGKYNPGGTLQPAEFRFPYDDASFDHAMLTSVFSHMYLADIARYLEELHRVLRPGGSCLFTAFLIDAEAEELMRSGRSSLALTRPVGGGYTNSERVPEASIGFDERVLLEAAVHSGFEVAEVYRGSWCGRTRHLSFQDLVVLRKSGGGRAPFDPAGRQRSGLTFEGLDRIPPSVETVAVDRGGTGAETRARPSLLARALQPGLARLRAALQRLVPGLAPEAPGASGPIRCSLDLPAVAIFTTAGIVRISGWAFAPSGIATVEAHLDGALLRRFDTGVPRPDLEAAFPTVENAARSGFAGVLDLSAEPRGDHELRLVIRDRAANEVRIRRTVRLVDAAAAELAVSARPGPILYDLDSPGDDIHLTSGVVPISGWACAAAGIEALEVHLDDVFRKRLDLGQARPDVAAAHPEVPGAARSGFSESLDLLGERLGDHALTLLIRDRAGQEVRVEHTVRLVEHEMLYHRYYLASLPTPEAERELTLRATVDGEPVGFEIWVAGDGADAAAVTETIGSVVSQGYPHWRLRVLHGTGRPAELPADERVSVGDLAELRAAAHEPAYLAFLGAGEVLVPGALARAAAHLAAYPDATLLYGDHDRLKPGGLHASPSFKPDWSPDHLLSRNYVGDFYFLRATEENVALCREALAARGPAWRFELLLRASERPGPIAHLADVLWSQPTGREADSAAEADAVRAALARRGWQAEVLETADAGVRRLRWRLPEPPRVSIIVPTTGNPALMPSCVESLLERTRYPNFEVVFLDNGRGRYPEGIEYLRSRDLTVLERDEPFNWAKLNNDGARESTGELLLFLNDDIEVVEPDWLEELVALAVREDVGCVGTMLVYPDDRIQHAGVFLVPHGGGARHSLRGLERTGPAYEQLHRVVREVSCNTGACLMVHRDLFERLGGFDEKLAIVGNDIDLCLRALEEGYRNLWTPHGRLIHHESYSRQEIDVLDDEGRMWERWGRVLSNSDPYYNINLTQYHTDCSLNLELLKKREQQVRAEAAPLVADRGINLIGYIRAEMGIGEAMRGLASALHAVGVPFDIYNYEHHNPARMGDDTWAARITAEPGHAINLLHVNADLTATAWSSLPPQVTAGRYTIGHWVWELPEFPDEWLEAFRVLDEVWTPSAFVQEAVSLKSPVPVVRVPYVVEKRPQAYLGRDFFGLPAEAFLFLTMYDVNSIPERKNPRGAIAAFRSAFAEDDARAGLVVKVNNCNDRELNALRELTGDHSNIHVVGRTLSRYEVDSLIHACDALLSLHRAEGFGLALAEAMALGRPVVATHWSGNTDFMHPANAACVDYRLVPLHRDRGPYRKGQIWADPDLEHAAWWMRRIRDDADLRERLVARARADVAGSLSARRVGGLVATRLKHLRVQ